MSVLFDTNILIDHLRGIPKAAREIERSTDPAISIITWIEVMAGASSDGEEAVLKGFLTNFRTLPVDDAVAERTAAIRRQRKLKVPDAILLATAELSGRELVTRNERDFRSRRRGIRVPYRI